MIERDIGTNIRPISFTVKWNEFVKIFGKNEKAKVNTKLNETNKSNRKSSFIF